MHAMVLTAPGAPLQFQQRNDPTPGPGAVRIAIGACGVCRTDLHVVDGELPGISYPIVPGHEVVGRAEALGPGVTAVKIGDRVGVPWLGYTCGECAYCRSGQENLCDRPLFTGYTRDGGFATHLVADARYCFPLGEAGDAAAIAPLLCTGLIGWRSLVMAGDGRHLGIYGFGCRRAYHRPGGALAGTLGLCIHAQGRCRGAETSAIPRHGLAEGSDELPPGSAGRRHHLRAGRCAGANGLARRAKRRPRGLRRYSHVGHSFFPLQYPVGGTAACFRSQPHAERRNGILCDIAPQAGIKTHTTVFPLREANEVLSKLRSGQITGAAVLRP
jgi:propanol-preferring alcohol dehydrogenase